MKTIRPKAGSAEAGQRLVAVLRKVAASYGYSTGETLTVSPGDISRFLLRKTTTQRVVAVAKAHPELVGYSHSFRKVCKGCNASREAAGYYEAQIVWIVS